MVHGVEQAAARGGAEDGLAQVLGWCVAHLVEVHQKVGLHQNLIVQTVHVGIGVVVGDEIAHPVDDGRIEAQPGQHLAGGGGALLLLGLAVVIAVFEFRVLDADVVGQRRGLQSELGGVIQALGLADEVGVGPDLGEVLNPARIARHIGGHSVH